MFKGGGQSSIGLDCKILDILKELEIDLDALLLRFPELLDTDGGLKVHLQNAINAVISGSITVDNMIPAIETGLAKDGTDGSSPPAVLGSGTGIRGWLRSIYEKLTGTIAVTGTFFQTTQPISNAYLTNQIGTWGYNAGISGTLVLSGGKKILQITAIAEELAATISINGGNTITLPYGSSDKVSSAITIEPKGNLVDPTIIFTGTKGYFCEYST